MPPDAMGVRNWSRWRSSAWGAAPLSLLLRGGRVEDGGVAGMLAGRAEAPRGELGLGSASGYAAALAGVGRLAGHQ